MRLVPSSRLPRQLLPVLVACCLAAVCVRPASAKPAEGPPWLKLDRVTADPSWLDGIARVRLYVSAMTLEGGVIPIAGKNEWVLQVGSAKKKLPYLTGQFKGVKDDDIALMLVLDTSSEMAADLPAIKEAAAAFINALPKDTSVGVVGYAEDVEGDRRVGSQKRALETLGELEGATIPSPVNLVKAVDYAVKGLRKAKPADGRGLRKMIVVVSDGQDVEHTAGRFRNVARKADRYDIRIHTMAYTTGQDREPMRGLAELSKVTFGTFRLVYSSHSFGANFEQLLKEVEQQYVLTYYVPADDLEGKKLKLLAKDIVSNDGKVKKVECGKDECGGAAMCAAGTCVRRPDGSGRGIFGWILLIGGIAVGGLVVLVGIGFVLTRRQERRAAGAALAAAMAENAAAAAPDHRILPQGPQGGVVAPAAGRGAPAMPPAGQIPGAPAGRVQPQGHAMPVHAAAPSVPSFVILSGAHQGRTVPVHHGFRMGKAPDCHLVLADDNFASGHHAHIEVDKGGGCTLVDEHSTNGTFINGVRAVRQRLSSGMLVKVGSTEMRFLQG